MFSRLSSFHTSFSSPHSFFTNISVDLFLLSEPTLDTEIAQSSPTTANLDPPSVFDDVPESPPATPLRRSTRVREPPTHLTDYHCFSTIVSLVEPTSYQEASTNPVWQKAIDEELQALEKTHTLGTMLTYLPVKDPLVANGFTKSKLTLMELLNVIKLGLLQKDTHKNMELTMKKHLPLLPG